MEGGRSAEAGLLISGVLHNHEGEPQLHRKRPSEACMRVVFETK